MFSSVDKNHTFDQGLVIQLFVFKIIFIGCDGIRKSSFLVYSLLNIFQYIIRNCEQSVDFLHAWTAFVYDPRYDQT